VYKEILEGASGTLLEQPVVLVIHAVNHLSLLRLAQSAAAAMEVELDCALSDGTPQRNGPTVISEKAFGYFDSAGWTSAPIVLATTRMWVVNTPSTANGDGRQIRQVIALTVKSSEEPPLAAGSDYNKRVRAHRVALAIYTKMIVREFFRLVQLKNIPIDCCTLFPFSLCRQGLEPPSGEKPAATPTARQRAWRSMGPVCGKALGVIATMGVDGFAMYLAGKWIFGETYPGSAETMTVATFIRDEALLQRLQREQAAFVQAKGFVDSNNIFTLLVSFSDSAVANAFTAFLRQRAQEHKNGAGDRSLQWGVSITFSRDPADVIWFVPARSPKFWVIVRVSNLERQQLGSNWGLKAHRMSAKLIGSAIIASASKSDTHDRWVMTFLFPIELRSALVEFIAQIPRNGVTQTGQQVFVAIHDEERIRKMREQRRKMQPQAASAASDENKWEEEWCYV
jgi:hypothetical protein